MKRNLQVRATLVAFALSTLNPSTAPACTGITIKPKDGSIIFARTLEFALDIKSNIIIVPRGKEYIGTAPGGKPGLRWKTKHGIVGANAFDLPVTVDGLNERGLSVGLFYFPGSPKYQDVRAEDVGNSLAPWELGSFLLGMCSDVKEAVAAAKSVLVGEAVQKDMGLVPPVHYIVTDASGTSVVLEYIGGELRIHDNPLGVMSNSPTFDWHMTNLSNYVTLSAKNVEKIDLAGKAIKGLGQGSGMLGLPGDFTPPSRFVRAVAFSKTAVPVEMARDGVLQAFHILNQFDIPRGAARGIDHGKEVADYTQWTSAADLKNLRYYFRTFDNSRIRMVDMKKVDLGAREIRTISLRGEEQIVDVSNHAGDPHLERLIKPVAGKIPTAATGAGESPPSTYVAPKIRPKDVLKGQLKNFTFASSTIFPGTIRQVTVFIPAQYDGSRPACVYVKTDGFHPIEQSLLETMIATREMPVTIGVFVRPGDLPATVKNTMGRRNRCFEYDGMGDNNVRFLVEELLPFVAKQFDLKLSGSGNDRCIAGGSSGGIAAFNAAWERPDAFSRVYANSGSFVAFRGGHEFPTLVRKFEAKPIRAYLTTGMHDMENCAGDWYLLDQEMDKALKFSGFDYSFRIINGGHVAGYYDYFREAMSYLWKNWPEPVKAGSSAPRVRDIILPDEPWRMVANDRHDVRGPATSASGEVFYIDAGDNKIHRIDLDGHIKEFLSDAEHANSLSFGSNGQLHAVSSQTGKIMSYDASGKGSLVVEGIRGQHLLATPAGGLYVTTNGEKPGDSGSVWFVKDGRKTQVDAGLKFATGLAYRPDQWLLSVADGRSKWVFSYQINADGTLANKERFFWLHVPDWEDDAGAESICYAREGPMLVATRWGIQVCADDGPTQVILPVPDRSRVTGVCLGGREMDLLFAFCGNTVWKRKVKLHGIGAFSRWTPANGSPL